MQNYVFIQRITLVKPYIKMVNVLIGDFLLIVVQVHLYSLFTSLFKVKLKTSLVQKEYMALKLSN